MMTVMMMTDGDDGGNDDEDDVATFTKCFPVFQTHSLA
jgi:hypothetical protein